jgi:pyruvate kinase
LNSDKEHYQIIATLGPAVKNRVDQLIQAGVTGFRLNCSHLTLEHLSRWLIELERVFHQRGDAMPVWLDLQGSKMRIGRLMQMKVVQRGEKIMFKNGYSQISNEIPLPHAEIFRIIKPGDQILLDDGRVELQVQHINNGLFLAEVINFGEISSFKGFVLRDNDPVLNRVSPRDEAYIKETRQWKFIGYAISYLKNQNELKLFQHCANGRPIVAKIERQKAFDYLREIAELANITWLCRGDLGVDGSIFTLYEYEKRFMEHLVLIKKPALIAGQVLENMVRNSYPSRSEIAHLGYLLENGFSGIVLSDETAIGKYPLESVEFCKNYLEYVRKK